jgi:acyl-CoA synthetase (AMP-forming)/AMP-acid ligase II
MRLLAQRLAEQAARNGAATALVHGARRVSFAELQAEAGRFHAALAARGVEPGDRVAVLGENSPEVAAAMYGVLGAGAVLVALNAGARAAEMLHVMAHAEVRAVLADAAHPETPALLAGSPADLPVVCWGGSPTPDDPRVQGWASVGAALTPAAPREVDPESPAAIVYTSGTTGAPKGVVLRHRNYAANVDAVLQTLPIDATDRTLCLLPFHYAFGASVLHTHVSAGAALVLENSLAFPQRVLAVAAAERVTVLPGVPSTFALLLERGRLSTFDLSSVRTVIQAGGALPPTLADRLAAALPAARLHLMYGQTEATARLTCLPPDRLADKRGSCGCAIPGVALKIVDAETGARLPEGATGEVCARGDNIMAGYWRDPAQAATVLRDGWLHTGDIGRLDAEGFLFLDGRRGDMIKTGAHRVSPFEIEEVVQRVEGVEEAVAVGVPDALLGQVVHVFIQPRPGSVIDPLAVQRVCRETLASYKVPKRVVIVSALPRTPSGKIQRHLLEV